MKLYTVIKKKLNIRNRATNLTDNSYVGQLQMGAQFWGYEQLVEGTAPPGTTNRFYVRDINNNLVAHAGVREGYLPDYISDFSLDRFLFSSKHSKGEGVTVIVIDSGFNNFSDISGLPTVILEINCIDPGKPAIDSLGHGTLMATIIGGKSEFCQGIAPNCEIIVVKYREGSSENRINEFKKAIVEANRIIESNPDKFYLINCSNSGEFNIDDFRDIQPDLERTSSLPNALFFSSVGNDGKVIKTPQDQLVVPCYQQGTITVSSAVRIVKEDAVEYDWNPSSNYWEGISLNAPGEYRSEPLQAKLDPQLFLSDTSTACAFTVGLTALYISQPELSKEKKRLCEEFIDGITVNDKVTIKSKVKFISKLSKEKIQKFFK